jgi:hypothetical protein
MDSLTKLNSSEVPLDRIKAPLIGNICLKSISKEYFFWKLSIFEYTSKFSWLIEQGAEFYASFFSIPMVWPTEKF